MIAWMVKSQRESRKVKKEKKRNGCEKEGPDGSPDSEKILGGWICSSHHNESKNKGYLSRQMGE